jgi:hypothetical protein
MTMSGATDWEKLEYDKNDTSYFNEVGERLNDTGALAYAQEGLLQFGGFNNSFGAAAGNTGGPLQDRAELKPEQSGGAGGSEQQSGSGQQGAGGMPSLPGGGGGSGSGSGSSKPQQPATGFASQQSPQQATPQNTRLLSGVTSQLSRLWGWLTGQGTTGGSAGSSAPVSIPL